MEWHISPIASKSYHSGKDFAKDDGVACALVKNGEGELVRVDTLVSEANKVEMPGDVLCRWTQLFKPKPSDGKEEAEALKLTADNLFISFFEGEEEGTLSEENAELKLFLGLMLERRRVLRVKARTRKYTRYVHRPSKREFLVPAVDLDPRFFIENEEKLSFLIDGGEDSEAGGDEPKETEES
ncbi:hypothetical protein [Pelagicoccus albus]|uniref:Uncharacterized protein n=1 Tax=Pelagicoccus albus TaxID=415222 RepID=A0A7X1E6Q9_9BACT|nr:hypothetical protein [Pelagicoccus albus]MBC2604970.1 hypothetical protein [Pelagicoccus albus]